MKIAFYTLGCKVNQYETQALEQLAVQRGHALVPFEGEADAYVINTCTVTAVSDRKSRQMIHRARRRSPGAVVAVCGCYAQTHPEALADLDVDLSAGTGDRMGFLDLLEALEQALAQDGNPYKVFITHTDITSGEGFNQSLIFTLGTADVAEQNRLYRLMDQYGVGLMMDGHRHSGGGLIHVSRSFWEYNHDALHTRDAGLFESRGCYYVYTLDVNTGRLTIDKHLAEDGSLISTQSITI